MLSPMMMRAASNTQLRREMEARQLAARQERVSVTTEVSEGACQVCGDFSLLYMVHARVTGASARLCPDCIKVVRRA